MKPRKEIALLMAAAILVASCSNKGIHMSKHRKSRKCNCPTFSERIVQGAGSGETNVIYADTRRTI